jgi:hypothetical protein
MYGQTGRSLGQPDHPGEKSDLTEAWVPGALSLSLSPVAHVRTDPGYDDHRRCMRGPRGSVYMRARGHNASSWLPYPARASSIRRIRQANLPRARRETGDVVPAGSLVPPSIIGFFPTRFAFCRASSDCLLRFLTYTPSNPIKVTYDYTVHEGAWHMQQERTTDGEKLKGDGFCPRGS